MSEQRYDRIDGFLWHRRGEPQPDSTRFHRLGISAKPCRVTGPTDWQSRDGLENFARNCGANALLDVYSEPHRNERGRPTGWVSWYGTPALYARPNDRGACTESELRNSFSQPKGKRHPKVPASEPRDWAKQQSEIFTCAVMGVVIFGGTMMSIPHAAVIALFLTTVSFGIWFLLPRSLRNVISQFFTRR